MPDNTNIQRNDPWGSRGNNDGPPDLDKIFKSWQEKFNKLLGQKPSTGGNGGSSMLSIGLISIIILTLWALSGIFIVRPAEQAVIYRFGKYVRTEGPGLHWIARFIEKQQTKNVEQVKSSHHSALMLTKDSTIVSVELAVQYRIGELNDFLFNVTNPEYSLKQATDSAMRQVIGHSTLDEVLTSGREQIGILIKEQIEKTLDKYKAGILVLDVPMQPAKAPEEVKAAFDDAIKAQEDQQREINKAEAYAKRIVPVAEGKAKRILAEAEAYRQQVIERANGDTDRFLSVLPEYQKAPAVTRTRLYLGTMEDILQRVNKIIIDSKAGNNLLYLPIDKMLKKQTASQEKAITEAKSSSPPPPPVAMNTNSRWSNPTNTTHSRQTTRLASSRF